MLGRGLHEVIYGGGAQTLVHIPPLRVASATYQIDDLSQDEDDSDREIVASTGATLDAFSTTTDAIAGVGASDPRAIPVADESGATAGTYYEIASSVGGEVFRAVGSTSGQITAAYPLSAQHPSGATVRGIQLSGTFPAATANNETFYEDDREFRVLWTYTLEGSQIRVAEPIRLVRSMMSSAVVQRVEQSLRATHAGLVQQCRNYANQLRDLVEDAADEITQRLRKKPIDVGQFMAGQSGFRLVKAKSLELMAESGIHPPNFDPDTFLGHMSGSVARHWNDLTEGARPSDATETDRGGDAAQPRGNYYNGGFRRA